MLQVRLGQALENQHFCPGKQRAVQLEGGVLGRRADQDDGAVFDVRQEGILLRAVEAVDFVHEENGALPEAPPVARLLEHLPQVLHAGENRRKLLEMQPGPVRHEPRHGGLAGSRRPPENHRARRFAVRDAAQRPALAKEMVLADDLGKRLRAQPVRKRPRGIVCNGKALEERSGGHGFGFSHKGHRVMWR